MTDAADDDDVDVGDDCNCDSTGRGATSSSLVFALLAGLALIRRRQR